MKCVGCKTVAFSGAKFDKCGQCTGGGGGDWKSTERHQRLCWNLWKSNAGFFLVGYVEERLWWPIQSPNIGGKKKASS